MAAEHKQEYARKLLSREWLIKREEILFRDEGNCTQCGDKENLHVHHQTYIAGREPWDYDGYDLITLCSRCHETLHERNNTRKAIEKEKRRIGYWGYPRLVGEVVSDIIS